MWLYCGENVWNAQGRCYQSVEIFIFSGKCLATAGRIRGASKKRYPRNPIRCAVMYKRMVFALVVVARI